MHPVNVNPKIRNKAKFAKCANTPRLRIEVVIFFQCANEVLRLCETEF